MLAALVALCLAAPPRAAPPAPPPPPAPLTPADFVGAYDVVMTVVFSSCAIRAVGDATSEQWDVSSAGGNLELTVAATPLEAKKDKKGHQIYHGALGADGVVRLVLSPEAGIDLWGSPPKLSGRRVVANVIAGNEACAIVYDVAANRRR